MKKNVLFVCIHNSARSQMAEAFLNQICGNEFEAHSAGIEPGKLNPTVVEVMQEVGIDISGNQTKSVFDAIKSGNCSPTSSPFATRRARNAARFFPASPRGCTGAFPTRPVFKARNDWPRPARCATPLNRKLKNGARKFAAWKRLDEFEYVSILMIDPL